ncbi:HetI protein [Myxococcus stipitatus DSM 14675]|uniref:HetI protein n=1 Tax=Myxococcus stipitatus (strain DSM 14675 / JCM 12634 / Mx s8) TaxID=1278073 RepID=L7UDE3_MYXSD|nr:4'-phosphopantetheinyl transferase superfamily protein [Myxococcus stipitatus]AGC46073.1 HetI protein [Myxococcus stipitatus DSM 14675]
MNPPDFSVEVVKVGLPGGQRVTVAVVPLSSVRRAWPIQPDGPISRVLTPAEIAASGMHVVLERRLAHLAGRVAAKLALLSHLRGQGYFLEARELGLTQMMAGPQEGRPVAQLPAGVPSCDVSISHSHGLALAVVASSGRVGVDLERVAPRSAAFQEEAFTDVERAWLEQQARVEGRTLDEVSSLGWCLKEALVKCSGHGLRAALQQVTFDGWTVTRDRQVHLAPLTDGPDAFVRLVQLKVPGAQEAGVTGLLVVGQGYALAVLHDAREAHPWRVESRPSVLREASR